MYVSWLELRIIRGELSRRIIVRQTCSEYLTVIIGFETVEEQTRGLRSYLLELSRDFI